MMKQTKSKCVRRRWKLEAITERLLLNHGKRWIGLGAVVRDYVRDPLVATCWRIRGNLNADITKALAARHGLRIALEAGLNSIILETDSLKLSHYLKEIERPPGFGRLRFSAQHVRRNGNRVAHELAKISYYFVEMRA
ncbi:Digeranylgeranylglyceryl phosphate synthase [Bienertia sinuspersici]